ncbi:hypothetical protein T4E_2332, partial [Trichinella pseudospiralis]
LMGTLRRPWCAHLSPSCQGMIISCSGQGCEWQSQTKPDSQLRLSQHQR